MIIKIKKKKLSPLFLTYLYQKKKIQRGFNRRNNLIKLYIYIYISRIYRLFAFVHM